MEAARKEKQMKLNRELEQIQVLKAARLQALSDLASQAYYTHMV